MKHIVDPYCSNLHSVCRFCWPLLLQRHFYLRRRRRIPLTLPGL